MEIIWSRFAKETLASIVEYVEDRFNSTVALKVYNKINNYIDLLVFFPRIEVKDNVLSTAKIGIRYIVNMLFGKDL